jgi:hypothetical protein
MTRIVTALYGVLALLGSALLGGMAAVVLADPAIAVLSLLGGVLGFLLFLSWALNPVIYRCPHGHPRRAVSPAPATVCSRCALQ